MNLWDQKSIDLVGPACIEFGRGRSGSFGFIAVHGWMDCLHGQRNGRPYVEFTWQGNDECDPASGRGWVRLEKDGTLRGLIYSLQGDNSGFWAVPFGGEAKPVKAGARAKRGTQ